MDTIWEIQPQDEQEIYVLFEEGQEKDISHSLNMAGLDTANIDMGIYSAKSGHIEIIEANYLPTILTTDKFQATVGSIRSIAGDEQHLAFGADRNICYVGKFTRDFKVNLDRLGNRTTFVTTSSLHKGTYLFKQVLIEFRRDPTIEEWRIPVRIPLVRIHRPHRDGCKAEMTISTTDNTDGQATFEILGIKGGGGQGLETQISTTLRAGTTCKEETIPAIMIVEHGATLVNGQAVAYGSRYRIVDIKPTDRETRTLPPEVDNCERAHSPIPEPRPQFWGVFNKTNISSDNNDSDDESVEIGSTDYVSVGLGADIPNTPLKLSVEIKRTMTWKYNLKTTLAGGAKYIRYPVNFSNELFPFELCWSIDK